MGPQKVVQRHGALVSTGDVYLALLRPPDLKGGVMTCEGRVVRVMTCERQVLVTGREKRREEKRRGEKRRRRSGSEGDDTCERSTGAWGMHDREINTHVTHVSIPHQPAPVWGEGGREAGTLSGGRGGSEEGSVGRGSV
jgi:hypothetical protein